MKILITGAAGFIGHATAEALLKKRFKIFGIDNLNPYYDVALKRARLHELLRHPNFHFSGIDLCNQAALLDVFKAFKPDCVIHLAAQPGVRFALDRPDLYIQSNIVAFTNVLEAARAYPVNHLLYASSSSVYGDSSEGQSSGSDLVAHPLSLYAATKRSNELIAHSYSHLFQIPTTGLRFFTVYGPWGRPDMAVFKFVQSVLDGEEIKLFNHGNQTRDMTYVDDIVDGITKLINHPPEGNTVKPKSQLTVDESFAPYRVLNIGNNDPVALMRLIEVIEESTGKQAKKVFVEAAQGDMQNSNANVDPIESIIGKLPHTPIEVGIRNFVEWHCAYSANNGNAKVIQIPKFGENAEVLPSLSRSAYEDTKDSLRQPKLSFLIRNRGESEWIGSAIQSIVDCCGVGTEIVVLDNGATDDSAHVVRLFERICPNLQVIELGSESYTPGRSLNVGFSKTSKDCDVVVVLSAHCQMLELDTLHLGQIFHDDPNIFAIAGKQIPIFRGKKVDPHSVWTNFDISEPVVNPIEKGSEDVRYFFHNAFSFIRKSAWEKNPFNEEITTKEDRLFAKELIENHKMSFIMHPAFKCNHFWTPHGATWKRKFALEKIPDLNIKGKAS